MAEETLLFLAQSAKNEVADIRKQIEGELNPIPEDAVRNLNLINQLRKLPSVEEYLRHTDKRIFVLGYGGPFFFTSKSAVIVSYGSVKADWLEATSSDSEKHHESPLNTQEDLQQLHNKRDKVVKRLAKLKPAQIIRKFEKELSSPVRIR